MDDAADLPTRHRLDVDDYHRMADAGILGEDDRVELIDGEIIDMAPIGQGHAAVVGGLTRSFGCSASRRGADSSLRHDLTVKLPLYARAGIAELWVVDLKRRALDAFRIPAGGGYAEVTTHRPGDRLALSAAPGITVGLDLMFG